MAGYGPDPALPNLGLPTPAASSMKLSGLTVPSKIVLNSLTTIWDDTKHIKKRVDMGIEY